MIQAYKRTLLPSGMAPSDAIWEHRVPPKAFVMTSMLLLKSKHNTCLAKEPFKVICILVCV